MDYCCDDFVLMKDASLSVMLKNVFCIDFSLLSLLLFCQPSFGHSGGTDSNGCHRDTKAGTRHCHSPKVSSPSSPVVSPIDIGVPDLPISDPTPIPTCDEFSFSRILAQADQRYVHAQCGNSYMTIQAH